MNLFYQPGLSTGINYLDETESRHLVKVLRRKNGDELNVTDGKGNLYEAVITHADASRCTFNIIRTKQQPPKPYNIHIAISPLKNPDRLEWFVEKAIEFGVDEITLLDCDHTEKHYAKIDRLQKISVSAMKQSLHLTLPQLRGPVAFGDIVRDPVAGLEKFIAHVDQNNPDELIDVAVPGRRYLILIGPEGDFSNDEVSSAAGAGFHKVSLGPSRLRTETAGIAACHILNLVNTRGTRTFK